MHRAQVLELLHEHLRKNVVRSGGVYLLQKVGIAELRAVPLLVSVFYAHLENAHGLQEEGGVPGVDGRVTAVRRASVSEVRIAVRELSGNTDTNDGVLCRWTDDLLYLSASRAPAERFLRVATRGIRGVRLRDEAPAKPALTLTSRDDGDDVGARTVRRRTDHRRARVRGLVRPARGLGTLECTVDYARYAGDRARKP